MHPIVHALQQEKPMQQEASTLQLRKPLLSTAREGSQAAVKTQHSQKESAISA